MGGQPKDSPQSSRWSFSQGSPALLLEIHEQPQALRETIRHNVDGNKIFAERVIFALKVPELLLPILEAVPLQLLAYHDATMNGCDVDHPRHLVKAVVRE
jgi:glucosamine 6-phosphate synthetase-like amidotransferase/phosphosugar isomerase protein